MGLGTFIRQHIRPLRHLIDIRREELQKKTWASYVRGNSTEDADITWLQVFNPSFLKETRALPISYLHYGYPRPGKRSVPAVMWWALSGLLKLPQNTGKYLLEYWPQRLEKKALEGIDALRHNIERKRYVTLSYLGAIGLALVYYLAKLIRFVARAVFSPWNHVKAGWEAGYERKDVLLENDMGARHPVSVLVDKNGRLLDENHYLIVTARCDNQLNKDILSCGQYTAYQYEAHSDGAPVKGEPVPTKWSWVFAGFNLLISLALIVVSLKYLVSSAMSWVATQIDSSLTAAELAQLSAEASVGLELIAGAAVAGHLPGIIHDDCYVPCCRKEQDEGVDLEGRSIGSDTSTEETGNGYSAAPASPVSPVSPVSHTGAPLSLTTGQPSRPTSAQATRLAAPLLDSDTDSTGPVSRLRITVSPPDGDEDQHADEDQRAIVAAGSASAVGVTHAGTSLGRAAVAQSPRARLQNIMYQQVTAVSLPPS